PEGKNLITAGWDGPTYFWDLATGRYTRRQLTEPTKSPGASGTCSITMAQLCVSPDGKTLAVVEEMMTAGHPRMLPQQTQRLQLWNLASGKGQRVFGIDNAHANPLPITYSADGKWLAFGPVLCELSGGK